ncbi:MAG: AsmA-like C-terminal region-containing protein [Planctomycetota bacterium]
MLRILKWLFGIGILLGALLLLGFPLLLNTAAGRNKVASVLGAALDREVTLGDLKVGLLFRSVTVGDLGVANPEGFPEGRLFEAKKISLEIGIRQLLKGRVEGDVTAEGVKLHVLQRGERTNLDGLAPAKGAGEEGGPDLKIDLHLTDSRLVVEDLDRNEKLSLDGVDLQVALSNRAGRQDVSADLRIGRIERQGVEVRDLHAVLAREGDLVRLRRLEAGVGERGRLSGDGRLPLRGDGEWEVRLDATDVQIEGGVQRLARALFPLAASDRAPVTGRFQGRFALRGRGKTWERIKPTLQGDGQVSLIELTVPPGALATMLAGWAGRRADPLELNDAGARFDIAQGWVNFQRLSARGDQVRYDLRGRVSLDGRLDLVMDGMPLLRRYGGKTHEQVARYLKEIPIRIRGTTSRPIPRFPRTEDLLGSLSKDAVEGALERILTGRKKKE